MADEKKKRASKFNLLCCYHVANAKHEMEKNFSINFSGE